MIPAHTKAALDRYVEHRLAPGGFLTAVLSNDLFGAVAHADAENRAALPDIVSYIYCNLPAMAWGNKDTVWAYLANKCYDNLPDALLAGYLPEYQPIG